MRAKQPKTPDLDALLSKVKALSPEALKEALAAHLMTHCKHGTPRADHCPWCHIDTPAYKQALADAMWHLLD